MLVLFIISGNSMCLSCAHTHTGVGIVITMTYSPVYLLIHTPTHTKAKKYRKKFKVVAFDFKFYLVFHILT